MIPHRNNIGLLRLLLALGVVISHGPWLHFNDGFRYDPLYALTRIQTLGDLCVDGFFLISGYLITQSWERSAGVGEYLAKRALRVYPAFAVAYVISCAIAILYFYPPLDPQYWRILILQDPPKMAHFYGMDGYAVNLPLWTIAYEFRAYLIVMLLGLAGLLAKPRLILWLTIALFALLTVFNIPGFDWRIRAMDDQPLWIDALAGSPYDFVRLNAAFLAGTCVYLHRATLLPLLTGRRAIAALAIMVPALFWRPTADTFLLGFGAVILFWLGFKAELGRFQRINDRWDISYGLYLYGWPVTVATVWAWPTISNWLYYPTIIGGAMLAGAISWFGMERYVKYRPKRAR
jgi:peptidoglycan/LPS O-acetylase OafA/YrhL